MTHLGKLLRYYRKYQGYSLGKVARGAGLTKTHIWELEAGNSKNPTVRTFKGLARALNVPARRLFDAALSDLETEDA